MYFPDLSPYPRSILEAALNPISVGWLAKSHIYAHGAVSEKFKQLLFEFCLNSVCKTRGFHNCEFCIPRSELPILIQQGDREIWLGSAEIRVVYGEKVYAAPNLIYHYIIAHNYNPPEEFIEAVLKGIPSGSIEYQILTEKHWKW